MTTFGGQTMKEKLNRIREVREESRLAFLQSKLDGVRKDIDLLAAQQSYLVLFLIEPHLIVSSIFI